MSDEPVWGTLDERFVTGEQPSIRRRSKNFVGDKRPQTTRVLIARLRRAATGLDKFKADLSNPQGAMVKPEALSAYANTCWQCAARLEELLERLREEPVSVGAVDPVGEKVTG